METREPEQRDVRSELEIALQAVVDCAGAAKNACYDLTAYIQNRDDTKFWHAVAQISDVVTIAEETLEDLGVEHLGANLPAEISFVQDELPST